MAVKGKTCQDIKRVDWISSSFCDSLESASDDDEDFFSPADKRAKLQNDKDDTNRSCDDVSLVENGVYNLVDNNLKSDIDRVWTDKYAPKRADDLIIHKKKVAEVSEYLTRVFRCGRRNNVLLMTGPTGCGKTCTLSVLCRFLKIDIIEWVTPIDNILNHNSDLESYSFDGVLETNKYFGRSRKLTVQRFNEFILQASKYSSLLSTDFDSADRKIVLIKDFPNVLLENPEVFHEIIKKYYSIGNDVFSDCKISPLVFIISDTNITRELFPDDLKSAVNISNINFNPVTQTNMVKALERILSFELNRNFSKIKKSSKEELIDIADSSDGDLRSAILKLQFNISHSKGETNFKIPRSVANPSGERIRVIKSSSSKLKNSKIKICEIDKDKTADFFNYVGRVLYPKREYRVIDKGHKESNVSYRFVHSPNAIADVYSSEPNKFINVLHENYLDRFLDIKDVCKASDSLSFSDMLMSSDWEAKETMVRYSLNATVRCLMVSNSKPAPNTFKPISKSRIWITENKKNSNHSLVRQIFPDVQCEKDILLDVIPYLNKLKMSLNLTEEQDNIISRIAKYNVNSR